MTGHDIAHDYVIRIRNLYKSYKLYPSHKSRLLEALNPLKKSYHTKFYALSDVSIDIEKGEVVGVIGKNGAGKSTLLKILTGVVNPSDGYLNVRGKIASLLELGAGFNPEMTGIENIYLNGALMGYSREEIKSKIPNILEFADIGEFIYQPVKMYSSGMFARLAFSVAINVEPDILIIDEALSVGDLRFQLKCMDKFDDFRRLGKTILFVSHDINAVKRFCSSCIWINCGKVEAIGNTDYVTDRYLDYLKSENLKNDFDNNVKTNTQIAEIISLNIHINGSVRDEINFGDDVYIEVCYIVHDEKIKSPVLGIAIHSIDNKYICGLNTLLDEVEIPWKQGLNKFYLRYEQFNLIGGSYHFDVALFEKNASVSFDYKSKYKPFIAHTPYVGEGMCIMKHDWLNNDEI